MWTDQRLFADLGELVCLIFVKQNVEKERLSPCIFVMDGAWNSELMSGAAV